jgi:hypothetical protein
MRPRTPLAIVGIAVLATAAACQHHDPKQELEVLDAETYWILDSPRGQTQYMAPAIRLRVRNKSPEAVRAIQATATFRRTGEDESWGSASEQVTRSSRPLEPGKDIVVVLRSDGHYTSPGTPEMMFAHALFKDVRVEVFLRVGSSDWVKMAEAPIERRVGSKTVEPLVGP